MDTTDDQTLTLEGRALAPADLGSIPALSAPECGAPDFPSCKSLEEWAWWRGEALPDEWTGASLMALEMRVAAALRPASPAEVLLEVERLRLHYGVWESLTDAQARSVTRDWLTDFVDYPLPWLRHACLLWRNSPAKRPPTAGQLKALVADQKGRWVGLGLKLKRARAALQAWDRRAP